jgi:hypothetical protein
MGWLRVVHPEEIPWVEESSAANTRAGTQYGTGISCARWRGRGAGCGCGPRPCRRNSRAVGTTGRRSIRESVLLDRGTNSLLTPMLSGDLLSSDSFRKLSSPVRQEERARPLRSSDCGWSDRQVHSRLCRYDYSAWEFVVCEFSCDRKLGGIHDCPTGIHAALPEILWADMEQSVSA